MFKLCANIYVGFSILVNYCMICIFTAAEAILLGFQHYLVMLGTTVLIPTSLVPQMGGGNVGFYLQLFMKILCFIFLFIKKFDHSDLKDNVILSPGRKGQDNSDNPVCSRFEHFIPDSVRDPFACCYRGVIYIRAYNHLDYIGWPIQ